MDDAAEILTAARRKLARLPAVLDGLVGDLDERAWRERPAPNEWSPVEIVCHLRDEEVEDFRARVEVVLDGGTRFAPIDPEQWAVDRRYLDDDPARALAALRERRAASLAFLDGVSPERLPGEVDLPRGGPLSGLDLLAAWVQHDALHVAQLAATVARLWADGWPRLRTDYAGPIPYPPDQRSASRYVI